LSAVLSKELVEKRGHKTPENYPFIIDKEIEKLTKTAEIKDFLNKLNLQEELKRSAIKKIRAGLGKLRGRKYQKKKGLLIVVGTPCTLLKSAKNIPGSDIVQVNKLNIHLLAPGCQPGRITLFTENAIDVMEKNKLFM
jgi:large subunit ribosomal protein L4e